MTNDPINDLKEIRKLMENSGKFISVSGLSAIFAGASALIGALVAYFRLGLSFESPLAYSYLASNKHTEFIFLDSILVFIAASIFGVIFTIRKAKKQKQAIWTASSRQLVFDFSFPLTVGGVFCLFLFWHGLVGIIAPAMLLFYGLSLLNASHKTLSDIRYLGYIQVILGCINLLFIGYGFFFWCLGFGLMHMVYGSIMYYKYER